MKKTTKMKTPWGMIFFGGLALLLLVAIVFFSDLIFCSNFAEVIPGEVYKSAQMTDYKLRQTIREHDIKAIINLRGQKDEAWYEKEKQLCIDEGVTLIDIGLSGSKRPRREELRQLVKALIDCQGIATHIHCRQGVDRASMAGALAVIVKHGDAERARDVFALKNLAIGVGFNGRMRSVLEEYLTWAEQSNKSLGHASLSEWAKDSYTGRAK